MSESTEMGRRRAYACAAALAVGICLGASGAAPWEFTSAKLVPDPAVGREISADVHEIALPSRRSIGWWTTTAELTSTGGVHFAARAEIALGAGEKGVYNDCMMFVTWYDPKYGRAPRKRFYQREFIDYADAPGADGRIVRTFDKVLPVPGTSDCVRVEFIAKWHPMTVRVSGLKVEEVARPAPRRVRCVVGNPHERRPKSWDDPAAVVAGRLAQIEATLTNIFAHVERPDIILFSEVFTDTGTPCPEKTAERIPGGPTFALASRYAKRHRCNIAMNVRERTDAGTYHNSTFIVDRAGELVGVYRKVTLTSGEYQSGMLPGDDFHVFQLDFGKVGCLTCWDNWFSESFKYTRRLGAELLLFPLAGCAPDHMDFVWPTRAIDTGVPILFCTRQGHLPSGVIDRDGTWAAQTLEDNGFAWADIDLNERKRTFWLSVGPGAGDPYDLYVNESRPELYERQPLR